MDLVRPMQLCHLFLAETLKGAIVHPLSLQERCMGTHIRSISSMAIHVVLMALLRTDVKTLSNSMPSS